MLRYLVLLFVVVPLFSFTTTSGPQDWCYEVGCGTWWKVEKVGGGPPDPKVAAEFNIAIFPWAVNHGICYCDYPVDGDGDVEVCLEGEPCQSTVRMVISVRPGSSWSAHWQNAGANGCIDADPMTFNVNSYQRLLSVAGCGEEEEQEFTGENVGCAGNATETITFQVTVACLFCSDVDDC